MFQTKFSVFEKDVILDHPIFLSVEMLKLRRSQIHYFKWNHARLPLIEAVPFAESLRELAQSSDLQKNMNQ